MYTVKHDPKKYTFDPATPTVFVSKELVEDRMKEVWKILIIANPDILNNKKHEVEDALKSNTKWGGVHDGAGIIAKSLELDLGE